jgi:hypothetical protein
VSPLPEGDLADQAAAYLRRLHGECFGDSSAIRKDLAWLEANGFCSAEPALAPIQLAPPQPEPPATGPWPGGVNGGFPPMGDGPVFMRVFTLLRHLLQQPFDQAGGVPVPEHLIERTEAIPGAYLPSATSCSGWPIHLLSNSVAVKNSGKSFPPPGKKNSSSILAKMVNSPLPSG